MPLIEIPFLYRAKVTMPGSRSERLVLAYGTTEALIREISHAPLAAVMTGEDVGTTYVSVDENLMAPSMVRTRRDGTRVRGPVNPAALEALVSQGQGAQIFQRETFADLPREIASNPIMSRNQARHWHSDDRLIQEAAVQEVARSALIIGGSFHFPSKGPTWYVDTFGPEVGDDFAVVVARDDDEDEIDGTFRGDRLEQALAFARMRFPHEEPVIEGTIEIMDASVFTWDDDQAALGDACKKFVREYAQTIQYWPKEFIVAWTDLRDTLAAWPDARTMESTRAAQVAFDLITGYDPKVGWRTATGPVALLGRSLQRIAGFEVAYEPAGRMP